MPKASDKKVASVRPLKNMCVERQRFIEDLESMTEELIASSTYDREAIDDALDNLIKKLDTLHARAVMVRYG